MAVSRDVRATRWTAIVSLVMALACAAAGAAGAAEIDPTQSRFGFSLQTRWGKSLLGRFPSYVGDVVTLADGRQQVRLKFDTRAVEIVGQPRYTEFSRGEKFFDAARYPAIQFISDPYPESLLRRGGDLAGQLTLHGVSRREVFMVAPATCPRPLHECDVVARGSVRRENYGMGAYSYVLHSRVRFTLNVRVRSQGGA